MLFVNEILTDISSLFYRKCTLWREVALPICAMLIIGARSNFKLWIVNKRFVMEGEGVRARLVSSCGGRRLSVVVSLNGGSHTWFLSPFTRETRIRTRLSANGNAFYFPSFKDFGLKCVHSFLIQWRVRLFLVPLYFCVCDLGINTQRVYYNKVTIVTDF